MRNINCEIYNITIPGSNWRVAKFEKKYANLKKNLFYLHSYRLKKTPEWIVMKPKPDQSIKLYM